MVSNRRSVWDMETIQNRVESLLDLPTSKAVGVPSYVWSTALMLHRTGWDKSPFDAEAIIGYDHDAAIREDLTR
jgi:hypothetical protein